MPWQHVNHNPVSVPAAESITLPTFHTNRHSLTQTNTQRERERERERDRKRGHTGWTTVFCQEIEHSHTKRKAPSRVLLYIVLYQSEAVCFSPGKSACCHSVLCSHSGVQK